MNLKDITLEPEAISVEAFFASWLRIAWKPAERVGSRYKSTAANLRTLDKESMAQLRRDLGLGLPAAWCRGRPQDVTLGAGQHPPGPHLPVPHASQTASASV